jgi:hypothetical protein
VFPGATVIVAGTVNNGLLLNSEIVLPPAGAAVFSVAEQFEIWPPLRLPGVQVIEEVDATVILPPAVVSAGSAEPVPSTPTAFDMKIDVVVALPAKVAWTFATIPADIEFVFGPIATQVSKPGVEVHVTVFPAATAAGPAVAPIAEISPDEYTRVHCNPAAAVPKPPKDSARLTVVPGPPVPGDKPKLGPCANAGAQEQRNPEAIAHQATRLRLRTAVIRSSSVPGFSFRPGAMRSCDQRATRSCDKRATRSCDKRAMRSCDQRLMSARNHRFPIMKTFKLCREQYILVHSSAVVQDQRGLYQKKFRKKFKVVRSPLNLLRSATQTRIRGFKLLLKVNCLIDRPAA